MQINRRVTTPLIFLALLLANNGLSQGNNLLTNPTGAPPYANFSINNLTSWLRVDGLSSRSPSGTQGAKFPRGTAEVIYQDGTIWGGKAYLDAAKSKPAPFGQIIRFGGAIYNTGCRPGRIIGLGANAVASDPNAPESRIYRIRRDYFDMPLEELRRDAAEVYEMEAALVTEAQMQAVREQYAKDWREWPISFGAPFIDRNRNGKYDPPPSFGSNFSVDSLITGKYDEPGLAGADPNFPADQVIWTVYNDLDRNQTTSFYGSEPLGVEAQVTLWGYKSSLGAGDFFFRRTRLINKGGAVIDNAGAKGAFYLDSLHLGQWADGDLGDFADDLHGCDTLRSMAYFYNSNDIDKNFRSFNLPPPAVGFDFVQGPRVPAPNLSAIFDLQRISGWKNLAMTSFSPKSSGSPFSDPPMRDYRNTLRWYNWLRGFLPLEDRELLYPFPPGVTANFFPLAGDPVAGAGFIDGLGTVSYYSLGPGDRRMTMSSGPLRFAPGDTQEVVVAVVAGLGADRLSSLVAMRQVDDLAQSFYNSLLALQPPKFEVEVTPLAFKLASIKIKATVKALDYSAMRVTLRRRDRTPAISFELYDDGMHEDGAVNDGIFANTLRNFSREPAALYLDAFVTDKMQRTHFLERVADFITTAGVLTIDAPVVFSDNLNKDEIVNPGENVRYGFTLRNVTPFDLARLRVTPMPEYQNGKTITINPLKTGEQISLSYNPDDPNTFLAFEVPASFADSVWQVALQIVDQNYNLWEGKLRFPVQPIKKDFVATPLQHLAGKADGGFEIRVINPNAIKNHLYVIYGVDSIDAQGTRGFTLKDSTDGRVLLFKHPLPDTLGHNVPVIDGFKIFRGSIPEQTLGGMSDWSVPRGQRVWTWQNANGFNLEGFNGAMGLAKLVVGFFDLSTITPAKARNVLIKFAATDTAGNVLDPNDPDWSYGYRYLRGSLNPTTRPEFALCIKNRGTGYVFQDYLKSVPFSAWDIEANPPHRLMAGHLENVAPAGMVDCKYWPASFAVANNTASTGPREWFFIFDVPYSEIPDSRLTQNILGSTMPIMWFGTPARNGSIAFGADDEFLIQARHFVTSRDVWLFNPTLVGISNKENRPYTFELAQNYPNPFSPHGRGAPTGAAFGHTSTQIAFSIPAAEKVTLKIYNMLGQEVATLVEQKLAAGKHLFVWDGTNRQRRPLASGVYFYRLVAGELQATKKLLLLR